MVLKWTKMDKDHWSFRMANVPSNTFYKIIGLMRPISPEWIQEAKPDKFGQFSAEVAINLTLVPSFVRMLYKTLECKSLFEG